MPTSPGRLPPVSSMMLLQHQFTRLVGCVLPRLSHTSIQLFEKTCLTCWDIFLSPQKPGE